MDCKYLIKEYCEGLGIYTLGFCRCRIFDELRPYFLKRKYGDIEKRINPFLYMEQGKTIISIAFPYLFNPALNSDKVYFSKYTQGRDYHYVVGSMLKSISSFIEKMGGNAVYFTDNNLLPEKYIASQCGVGFIGKNNLIITEKYGSFVFLGEIITDLDMEADSPSVQKCGSCSLCSNACPTKSLNADNCFDKGSDECLSYITQKKDIEDKWLTKFGGRMFGCDTCQRICPYNKDVSLSSINEFKPYDYMENVNLSELINMNNSVFNEKYKITSSGWRGKNILKRNALINRVNLTKSPDIDVNSINSPYVREYYIRLLNILKL
jgi:epoxyqueuosine reductase